jgi:6,7-dimethyl-8-ribityllumazine synthase
MKPILIINGQFYTDLAAELRAGAQEALKDAGLTFESLDVPGALEIPQAIRYAIASGKYAGYVALGTVIRGETGHYDIVANESSRALMDLALAHQAPIGNGILTVENDEQAWERADRKRKNKGADAANAVIALLKIKEKFVS